MSLKLALPKGGLFQSSSELLQQVGISLESYDEQSRSYRPRCSAIPELNVKVFHEKDIPIQVATGNYDVGICGLVWADELLCKYRYSDLVKVHNLGYGRYNLYVAASRLSGISSLGELKTFPDTIRIASEYPNLAEHLAMALRLKKFKIFPLWGAAEAYPPENADIILSLQSVFTDLSEYNLIPLTVLLQSSAFLVANRSSWESKDLSRLLQPLLTSAITQTSHFDSLPKEADGVRSSISPVNPVTSAWDSCLRLALPDGHQQHPTIEFLRRAGIIVRGNFSPPCQLRINLEDTLVKVIRPQDMPLQIANGGFDLAVTGKDWVLDHLYQFPTSPVKEILDLGFGRVKIVAVVSEELGISNLVELKQWMARNPHHPIRIASEYINIADRFACDNHLSPYRLIPTWGASEGFLPEDADLLIENTQTGRTLAQHKLRVIATLFESSACLLGRIDTARDQTKQKKIDAIVPMLERAL